MLTPRTSHPLRNGGFTMLEVLISIIIIAFSLLGVAALMSKMQVSEMESYQRSQAVVLLNDMVQRMNANSGNVSSYVNNQIGTGDSQPATCTMAAGAALDLCEWSNALKGAAEQNSGGSNVGAMIGAVGCITQLQARDDSSGVCLPGIYRVTLTWQGLQPTATPALYCPSVTAGNTTRSISSEVTVGSTTCS